MFKDVRTYNLDDIVVLKNASNLFTYMHEMF